MVQGGQGGPRGQQGGSMDLLMICSHICLYICDLDFSKKDLHNKLTHPPFGFMIFFFRICFELLCVSQVVPLVLL